MYGNFAGVYDQLMDDVDYDGWALHYRRLLAFAGIKDGARVIEGACGTGSLTARLAKSFDVSPRDLSPDMLSVAARKARDNGLTLAFVQEDIRAIQTTKPVDAVICGCDAANYLLTQADMAKFLRGAFAALRPGGALAFDVSSAHKLRAILGDTTRFETRDDICYIWHNQWDARAAKLRMLLTIFVKTARDAWERIEEEQVQRAWEEREIMDMLKEQGFIKARCFGGMSLSAPALNAQRLHFVAVKPVS